MQIISSPPSDNYLLEIASGTINKGENATLLISLHAVHTKNRESPAKQNHLTLSQLTYLACIPLRTGVFSGFLGFFTGNQFVMKYTVIHRKQCLTK